MEFTFPTKHNASDTTIFSVMSALSQHYDAINLSQGFPDFSIDSSLSNLLYEASLGNFNQYAPMLGLPMLREAIAKDFKARYSINIDPNLEITICPGATYAIYTAFSAILNIGDEVIVLEPAYDSYIPNIEMNGAKAIPVKLDSENFAPDWQKIKEAITAKTKAIIVNTPHNPTGSIWSKQDWEQLAELLRGTNIYVLSDEVYEQLLYDNMKHFSVLENLELRERSFALYSFGKAFHNTGWKIGYCIAPPAFTKAFRQLHQYLAFSVNTPAQYALAKFMENTHREPAHIMLQNKRDYFIDLMKKTPFKMLNPAKGSYFQLASYAHISDMADTEFAAMLTKDYGVATIPVSPFYSDKFDNKILRFCFAKKEETLEKAVERLMKLNV
jgi:methionine aminotransferase